MQIGVLRHVLQNFAVGEVEVQQILLTVAIPIPKRRQVLIDRMVKEGIDFDLLFSVNFDHKIF